MIKVIKQFSKLIQDYQVEKYRTIENSYQLVFKITFIDNSELHVSDYLFLDEKRKYAYHYQDENAELIFRYDTAPHWKNSKTFPYHKHLKDNIIIDSKIMYLENVLNEIAQLLK